MKIEQLLSGIDLAVTNEEKKFIKRHQNSVTLSSLDDHDQWLAQNLVRKGVYEMSKDHRILIKSTKNA